MVWWLKLWCASIKSWVQSLMDVCIIISPTNVVNKHVHPNENIKTFLLTKLKFVFKKLYKKINFFHDM
jgi:hypothetical protein